MNFLAYSISQLLVATLILLHAEPIATAGGQEYLIGVGIADVTGPPVQVDFFGYAEPSQKGEGIHIRLFSRAFIFQTSNTSAPVVFVSVDIGSMDQAIKRLVIEGLRTKYGSTYSTKNVLLSATHTHSGPGKYQQYNLYGGLDPSNFQAIVDGIVESIEKAHENRQPAYVSITRGELRGASINRSPSSYEANPQEERDRYTGNIDTEMVVLRIDSSVSGAPLGLITWFAVHPTSMNKTNKLVSGDNKGYASQLFEAAMNPGAAPGKGKFVAAFASTNLGDVSPNTAGPRCIDSGDNCDYFTTTCLRKRFLLPPKNSSVNCIAFGPGKNSDMKDSTRIIGDQLFKSAQKLFDADEGRKFIAGDIQYAYQYVNMSGYEVKVTNSSGTYNVTTCPPTLGFSFAAGTSDGPGPMIFGFSFDFYQGDTRGKNRIFWEPIRDVLGGRPSPGLRRCHAPKPILANAADSRRNMLASIVDTQVIRVGNLFIIGFPGEATTMAGRRLREAIQDAVRTTSGPGSEPIVILAGLSNVYTHYVTTFEEYQKQRYEAASTLYGPHTLSAYIQQFTRLTQALLTNTTVEDGPEPPFLVEERLKVPLLPNFDTAPIGKTFGDCTRQPKSSVYPGEVVEATFVSGRPRYNSLRGDSFFFVERKSDEKPGEWQVVDTDAGWATEFYWSQSLFIPMQSSMEFKWEIPLGAKPGTYRVRHQGTYALLFGQPVKYEGLSDEFTVLERLE